MPQAVPPGYAPVYWVAVHGGAGASTLSGLTPGSTAVTRTWPTPPPGDRRRLQVVLVARSHYSGLLAAQRAMTEWAAGIVPGVDLVGLVVVADAPGRLPKPLRDLVRLLTGGVPQLWQLPWSEQARLGQLTDPTTAPREHRTLLTQLQRLLPELAGSPTDPATTDRPGPSASPLENRTNR